MSERELDWDEPAAQTPYVRVPNWVIDHGSLSIYAKGLYTVLSRYINGESGNAWPGIPLLAQKVGCGTTKINDAVGELEAIGALTKKRRGRGMSNLYRLRFSEVKSTATRSSRTPPHGGVDDRHAVPNKTEENKTELEVVVVAGERVRTDVPYGVDAEVIGALKAGGFDDLTIEQHRGQVFAALQTLRLPPDVDWFRVGNLIEEKRRTGAMKAKRPDSALKFVLGGIDGPPLIGTPSRPLFGGRQLSATDSFTERNEARLRRMREAQR